MKTLSVDVKKAEAAVAEWEAKAERARGEAVALDQGSGALILERPREAERITVKIQAKEREARAYDSAAAEARQRLVGVYRRHLEAAAVGFEKAAVSAQRECDEHAKKEQKLRDQLQELEGVPYVIFNEWEKNGDGSKSRVVPRSEQLRSKALTAEGHAEQIRHFLDHGELPPRDSYLYHLTPCEALQAALDAGVSW